MGEGEAESTFYISSFKVQNMDFQNIHGHFGFIDISNFSPKDSCFCEVFFLITILPNKSTQICKINKRSVFDFTFKQKDTPVREP